MKFRKNWKRFFSLNRHHAEGFTLVELIVVIAILAILGGVAVPAYSGYVKKANMQADMTLASEVAHALTLQYYAEGLEGASTVIITKEKAIAKNQFAEDAMNRTFGSGWENTCVLKYDDWSNGTGVTSDVLGYFNSVDSSNPLHDVYNGNAVPTFANDVDELFITVRDTAQSVSGILDTTGADLVKMAADYTLNANNPGVYGDASNFAAAWSDFKSVSQMGDDTYNEDFDASTAGDDLVNQAVANAAIIKARNTALATYLRDAGHGQYYDKICNLTVGNSALPQDLAALITVDQYTGHQVFDDLAAALGTTADDADFMAAVTDALGYFDNTNGNSPAYKDALAYYAMMDTINHTSANTSNSDEEYWDELAGAVSVYGDIASGRVSLTDISGLLTDIPADSVAVLIMNDATGLKCSVIPKLGE